MRSVNEIPVLLSGEGRGHRFTGAVFSAGEDTLLALKKVAAILPIEFAIYAGAPALPEIESQLGNTCFRFGETTDPVLELSQFLLGKRPAGMSATGDGSTGEGSSGEGRTAKGRVRKGSGERAGNFRPCDFVVRGDSLSLEDAYRAISIASSAENIIETAPASRPGTTQKPSYDEPRADRLFLSHIALLDAPVLSRVLVLSDGFVNPRPDIKTRIGIVRNSLSVCDAIGISAPRVALLAAVEQVYPGMPVTVESAEISKIWKAGETRGAQVDGPLSFDVALDEQVAKDKGASGDVAGKADVLIGSSVEVASGIYMAQTVLGRANAASVVVGGRAPLALPFPSDCVDNVFFSICLACLLSRRWRPPLL